MTLTLGPHGVTSFPAEDMSTLSGTLRLSDGKYQTRQIIAGAVH